VTETSVLDAPAAFDQFLQQEQAKDLLRFTTAGSVDDGKSTLIGRLLYDSRSVYEDQLESVTKASIGRNVGAIDFSLLTDGLRAEREQGITIDVAYRYFATPKRKFIIADTPGHEQYTRNMVTGASTAELAIILVDARKGLLAQSRRHAYISLLLGLPNLVIAVNKMDLVGYDQQVFAHIETEFRRFLLRFQAIEPHFVPISALVGDNVVTGSKNMPWFNGPSLLEYLETVPVGDRGVRSAFRFPVQRVVRPDLDFRGYAGTVAGGLVRTGDAITVLPSGRTSRVSRIVTFDGDREEARTGESVTLTLEDDVDIGRGDLLAHPDEVPEVSSKLEATLVWLNEAPAEIGKRYRLKHAASLQWADLKSIEYRTNINTLEREPANTLEMNVIGAVRIETVRPLAFDSYQTNRITGSFILIDAATNATVAAGMITGHAAIARPSRRVVPQRSTEPVPVTEAERRTRQGHAGAWIELGGREELAWRLERLLFDRGCTVYRNPGHSEEITRAFYRFGALVVVAGSAERGSFIETAEGRTRIEANSASGIEHELEKLQVFTQMSGWSGSGGGI
jgi:sulfate adenylyltransferase large subunit